MSLMCLVFLSQVIEPGLLICVSDDHCDEGYTCIDGTCTECLTCTLLFRNGSPCVTDFRKCGDCLDGYEEVSVTDFSTAIKACKPVQRNTKFKDCTRNNNCPPGNYCSEDSCVPCFDCGVVNRLPPVDNCAKGLTECDSCIDGFSEAAATADTNHTQCVMETTATLWTIANFQLFAAFIFALGVFFFFIFLWIKIRKFLGTITDIKINSQSPPQNVDGQHSSHISPQIRSADLHVLCESEQRQVSDNNNNNYHPVSRLNGSQEHDSTDSNVPATNEINMDSNDSVNLGCS